MAWHGMAWHDMAWRGIVIGLPGRMNYHYNSGIAVGGNRLALFSAARYRKIWHINPIVILVHLYPEIEARCWLSENSGPKGKTANRRTTVVEEGIADWTKITATPGIECQAQSMPCTRTRMATRKTKGPLLLLSYVCRGNIVQNGVCSRYANVAV